MTHRGQDWADDASLPWSSHSQPCVWAPRWPCNSLTQPLPACQHQMEALEERNGDLRKDSNPTVLARAAIINTITWGIKQQIFISRNSRGCKVQDQRVGRYSVLWGPTSLTKGMASFLLSSHVAFPWWLHAGSEERKRQREKLVFLSSFHKALIPIIGPTCMMKLNPNHPAIAPFQPASHCELRIHHINLRGIELSL